MQSFLFYLVLPFILLISVLPMSFLYVFARVFVFPLLYFVLKYRRSVVQKNLINSFPEKSKDELAKIEKEFYYFLSDLFVETFKSFTISKKHLLANIKLTNIEIVNEVLNKNKSCIITCGHMGNYEYIGTVMPLIFNVPVLGVYRKMSNLKFDAFFKKCRERFGSIIFPTNLTLRRVIEYKNKAIVLALANDQSAPSLSSYWTRFLNQDTSFYNGSEKIATSFDMAIFFMHINRYERGKYEISFENITVDAKNEKPNYVLEKHADLLEKDITKHPEIWLWSHKRWKHKMPEGTELANKL